MVVFVTTCVECDRRVELPISVVTVRAIAGRHRWTYVCPSCHAHVERDADDDTVSTLVKGGVTPTEAGPPPLPTIAGKTPTGPPITEDEFIQFGRDLEALA